MLRSLLPAAAAAAACLLPSTAHAWGLLVPVGEECVPVAEYSASLTLGGAGVHTRVTVDLADLDRSVNEPRLLLPAAGDAPVVRLDGVAQHLDFVPAADALDLLVDLAEERGDPSPLALAGSDLWDVHLTGTDAQPQRIEIEGVRPLAAGDGQLHVVHPLRPGQSWCGPASRIVLEAELPALSGRAWATLFAPYHDLVVSRSPGGGLHARSEQAWTWPAFDFHLYAVAGGGPVGASVLSYAEPACDGVAEDGTFALVAAPTGVGQPRALDKDLVLVLDTSGSMAGDKIAQARQAASYVLEHLGPGDRFDVIDFDRDVRSRFDGLVSATPEALAEAMAFVGTMSAGGATNIHDALVTATGRFDAGGGAGRAQLVVFATDGQPTEGPTDRDAILDAVRQANRAEARIFPFGVGYDVNTFLLDGLAAAHGGVSSYVHPDQDVSVALAAFSDRIQAPVMTRPALRTEVVAAYDVLPRALPDLFSSTRLVAVGRYADAARGAVHLDGDLDGDGWPETVVPDGRLVRQGTLHSFLPRLWAARMVADLIALDRQQPGDEARVERIRTLARRYGIATPFTSFYRDDQGNVRDAYERPTDEETGERSVNDSDAVNAMNANDNAARYGADEQLAGLLRHLDERTFLAEEGRWVDTSVDPDAPVVELSFASPAYRRWLAHDPSLARYLSVGRNVVFRHRCQVFRITDPRDVEEEEAPPEESVLAPEEVRPGAAPEAEWMEPAEPGEQPAEPGEAPPAAGDPPPGAAGDPPAEAPPAAEGDEPPSSKALCAQADPVSPPGPWSLLLLLAVLGRGIVPRRWTVRASRPSTSDSDRSSSGERPRS